MMGTVWYERMERGAGEGDGVKEVKESKVSIQRILYAEEQD